jgi:glycosyltransferase involved in cell wall biosynthesis
MQIHATNINGLGASQVVISLLQSLSKNKDFKGSVVYLPETGLLQNYYPTSGEIKRFRRFLPNSISRLLECMFSRLYFDDKPTIVLGDIPLRGIKNQIVLVHQPNLIKPSVNPFSGKSLNFRINRFLFELNHKYAKKIIVQTGAMAAEMIASYPSIKNKIIISPQPVPNWLSLVRIKPNKVTNKVIFFYPAAFYPHKKHQFLNLINKYLKSKNTHDLDFEIWLTLSNEEFLMFRDVKFLKNLGRLNTQEMNKKYSEVDALLFLSSMESYGLPLIEALTLNLPILVADFNYSRWLCEDLAYYFKPYDEQSFINSLNILSKDISEKKEVNYTKVLTKFPKDWSIVAEIFINALKNN